jgi:ribosomal protein S18 acetylase RimI-like enzyme
MYNESTHAQPAKRLMRKPLGATEITTINNYPLNGEIMILQIEKQELMEKLLPLFAEVECGNQFDIKNPLHTSWLEKRLTTYIARGATVFAYYLDRNKPIGFALLLIDNGPVGVPYLGQYAEILDIGVLSEYRGKGYGSELLKYAEKHAKDSGVYCLGIYTTETDRDAIAFYKKNGFDLLATIPDVHGLKAPGKVWMRKLIQK